MRLTCICCKAVFISVPLSGIAAMRMIENHEDDRIDARLQDERHENIR